MKIKCNEKHVYEAVLLGHINIDRMGRVWRVGMMRWNRWKMEMESCALQKVRAEKQTTQGYLQVRVMVHGIRYNALAHRLVYHHVFGPIPVGMTVNHRNGVKDDNRPENLELATYKQQMRHCIDVLGKHRRLAEQWGEQNHAAKPTSAEVVDAIRMRDNGATMQAIADRFGVTMQHISKIVRRERRCRG